MHPSTYQYLGMRGSGPASRSTSIPLTCAPNFLPAFHPHCEPLATFHPRQISCHKFLGIVSQHLGPVSTWVQIGLGLSVSSGTLTRPESNRPIFHSTVHHHAKLRLTGHNFCLRLGLLAGLSSYQTSTDTNAAISNNQPPFTSPGTKIQEI